MSVYAYQYGCLQPIDWRQDASDCLYRQNKLWNRLVEIERENREKWLALMAEDPTVATLEARNAELTAEVEAAIVERRAARKAARKKVPTPELDERIACLSAMRKAVAAEAKSARKSAREVMKPRVEALADERYNAVTTARQEAAADGLWWGHYNAVIASYETARVRAMKEGADLRFHSFDGQGRFTNQIQGGADIADLFAHRGPVWLDRPENGEYRDDPRIVLLRLTIRTDAERQRIMLTLPMVMHRPLPDGARIKQVVVTRRKIGTRYRYHAVFTLDDPAPAVVNDATRACGVNPGFRVVPDGLRVATRVDSRGRETFVVLPTTWLDRMEHVQSLQGRLDDRINEVHAAVRAWWRADDPEIEAERVALPEDIREMAARIAKAPKIGPGKLAGLTLRWRTDWEAAHGGERYSDRPRAGMLAELESWRAWDKRKREEMDNLRDKLLHQRREIYRVWAADTARDHGVVGVTAMDLRAMAIVETRDGVENVLHAAARSNRQLAAPSELVGALKVACQRHGAQFISLNGTASTCHVCGSEIAAGADLIVTCRHCEAVFDQDVNASRNACSAAVGCERPDGDGSVDA